MELFIPRFRLPTEAVSFPGDLDQQKPWDLHVGIAVANASHRLREALGPNMGSDRLSGKQQHRQLQHHVSDDLRFPVVFSIPSGCPASPLNSRLDANRTPIGMGIRPFTTANPLPHLAQEIPGTAQREDEARRARPVSGSRDKGGGAASSRSD